VCAVHTETRGVIFEGGRPVGFSPRCTVDEISGSKVRDRVFQVAEIPGALILGRKRGHETTRLTYSNRIDQAILVQSQVIADFSFVMFLHLWT